MIQHSTDRPTPIPGTRIRVTDSWNKEVPSGIEGTVTKIGTRPNDVMFYDVRWDNGIESHIYDALLYHHCEILN